MKFNALIPLAIIFLLLTFINLFFRRKILNSYIKNIKVEFIDNYYKIDIEWNILGYRDKVYLVHKSYGHYIYNDIEYSLKESKEKTTLERVLKNLKKYDKPPREK